MPVSRNALIRYKTIDTCLRNRFRKWTLEDLVDACSDALYEYEDIDKGISKRTVQMDIQLMRSEKLGYNAPIVVKDHKYYTYEDPEYSITNTPLSEQDLKVMSEAVELLKQFNGFSYFSGMGDIISRLEDHVTSVRQKTTPIIDFEKNNSLTGLNYLNDLYQAILNQQPLSLKYRSFKARSAATFVFYPYLLKEYRNRWFVFGSKKNTRMLYNLALDRILELAPAKDEPYYGNSNFDPSTFFDDIVGVTKGINQHPEEVRFWVNPEHAPYVLTKPIHKSQHLIEQREDGSMVFQITVVINHELQREILGFGDGIRVLYPASLVRFMKSKFRSGSQLYTEDICIRISLSPYSRHCLQQITYQKTDSGHGEAQHRHLRETAFKAFITGNGIIIVEKGNNQQCHHQHDA